MMLIARPFLLAAFLAALTASPVRAASWRPAQAERLANWLDAAENEALPSMADRAAAIRAALASGDPAKVDAAATPAALDLARLLRNGSATPDERRAWNIPDDAEPSDPEGALAQALSEDGLDRFLGRMRPAHPWYARLQRAYVNETDPARRATVALNLERWRWMPRDLGPRYLIANTATFELTLWENGRPTKSWPVIVGKPSTPTPVFVTRVTGVIFNPWWEIPDSIVAESVGELVRNHPVEARRKGYVVENGRYRQKPGPENALGRMKLVMPNGYNVYLHDSPAQALFERGIRTFSHGCVRVGDALELAGTLLADQPEWPRARIAATVDSRQTVQVALTRPLPVYLAYFTAEPDEDGHVEITTDVYRRDRVPPAPEKK